MKFAFITGMGRSGTKFLAHLLVEAPAVEAHHELIGDREFSVLSWYMDQDVYAIPYLQERRRCLEEEERANEFLIDVNSYLRHAVPALRAVFGECEIYHLVRDPRAVVPSIMLRRNDQAVHILPKEKRGVEQWLRADKFEQICINWAETTTRLLEQGTTLLLFEKILSDYTYVRERLLLPLGIDVDEMQWAERSATKVNKTRSWLYRYLYAKLKNKAFVQETVGSYEYWSPSQRDVFADICGGVMEKVGYDL